MKTITFDDFIADWQRGLLSEVTGAGTKLYGKATDKEQGYIIVFCDVPA